MKDYRFTFDLPAGWQDQTAYIFQGPTEGGIEHRLVLNIDRRPELNDIESFAKGWIDPIVSNLSSIEILKDEETTIDKGHPAYDFVYKKIVNEGQTQFQRYVFVIRDGLGFIFSCCFSKMTYKLLQHQMNEVIESLVPGTYLPLEED
ncbi:MAG: DUF1795 domain-containing protein [Methanosarcinaceae archaeon]|nr:DUF1795 domain-containing protein [Methanosarcinaceae archaeon]